MLGKNNSYFDVELCQDGHYIVTGYTNDQFCGDALQLSDVKYELHRYLRYDQHFDAVFFLDSVNMLFCYDQQSYDILRGEASRPPERLGAAPKETIVAATPLGHRRCRREQPAQDAARAQAPTRPAAEAGDDWGPLHMGRQAISSSWAQVTALLRSSEYRCALVLSNVDSLIGSMGIQEMAILEELQSYRSRNHSIVIYIFRDTTISTLFDSVGHSQGGASNQWARFVQNVLLRRIESGSPEGNRVISLRTPGPREVRNLLNYMRLRPEVRLRVLPGAVEELSDVLASSCARQKWGLGQLLTRLDRCSTENPDQMLSMDNWKEFTGEQNYRPPMEQLEQLVGMESVKRDIREWYEHQLQTAPAARSRAEIPSRFAPLPARGTVRGHTLNIRLKGNPGTGKTTVARLMGMLYYQLGLLPQGQLVERTASDLVSQNVGGTARLVRERVQEAMGGVLFIDEAYSLATNQHGLEAINQLVSDLSTYEGQFAVVLAGYPGDIDRLMRENDGLARRFPTEYVLPDYSPEEMEQIFRGMVRQDPQDVVLGQDLEEKLSDFCSAWVGGRTRGWGNAGEAENLLMAMKKRCSVRMAREGIASPVLELTAADIPEHLQHCLTPRSRNLREALEEIDRMIGLTHVKKFLKELSRNLQWGVEEKAPGNYIFSGAPGTGKTTVARRMGEILGHLGVLRRKVNNVTECRAADLLNGTVNLKDMVEDARGGILFIDEAHQLEQNSQGHAIIRELVPLIEDPEIRGDTCFICAGYTVEMRRFLEVDRGLSRRFPANHRIRFDDYNASELTAILESMACAAGEIPTRAYLNRSQGIFSRYLEQKPANFGNGGFVRDVYLPDSIAACTARLNAMASGSETGGPVDPEVIVSIPQETRRTLTEEDVPKEFLHFAGPLGQEAPLERNAQTLLHELYGKDELVRYVESRFQMKDDEIFFENTGGSGMHFSIAGPQGSGRHTVVKAVTAAWYELGLLERNEVMFVGKSDLEAGYVGQTAIKSQSVVEQALGGTLAICSPSAMLPRNANESSFGPEALQEIMNAMAAHTQDLCVVFLDTFEGMELLFKHFPGVRSHLSQQFVLEDLSPEDMLNIFRLKTETSLVLEDSVEGLLPDFFLNWVSDRGGLGESVRSWGNANEVNSLIQSLIQNWRRTDGAVVGPPDGETGASAFPRKRYITRDMFPPPLRKYLSSNRAAAETALQELEGMTGLRRVKESIKAIERRMRRMPSNTVMPGLYCYLGNPGVGKTTVAKLMGGILRAAGVLSQGHVIIRTARQMSENPEEFDSTLKLAANGILFIDEAHQLADPANPYGRAVIKKLLTVLEDADVIRDTCIILAGYPEDMTRLFAADSGLSSRFGTANSIIFFENYTPEELLQILDQMAAKAPSITQIGSGYPLRLSEDYRRRSLTVFQTVAGAGQSDYGNARFVRNYLHDSVDELLERMDREYGIKGTPPPDVADYLTGADIPRRYRPMLDP